MKKFILLFFVIVSFSVQKVHSQMPVIDATVSTILATTGIETALHYAQTLIHQAESVAHFITMIENMGQQLERQVQNLQSAKDNFIRQRPLTGRLLSPRGAHGHLKVSCRYNVLWIFSAPGLR
jgi:ribosome-associated translation inhibitor RaiA